MPTQPLYYRVIIVFTAVLVAFLVGQAYFNAEQLDRIEAKLDAPAVYTIPAPADLTPYATSTPSLPRG